MYLKSLFAYKSQDDGSRLEKCLLSVHTEWDQTLFGTHPIPIDTKNLLAWLNSRFAGVCNGFQLTVVNYIIYSYCMFH